MWFTWLYQKLESTWKNFPVQALVCSSYHVRIRTDWLRFPFSHSPFHEHEPSVCCNALLNAQLYDRASGSQISHHPGRTHYAFVAFPPNLRHWELKWAARGRYSWLCPVLLCSNPAAGGWLSHAGHTWVAPASLWKSIAKRSNFHGCIHLLFSWWQNLEITVLLRERTNLIACTVLHRHFSYWECRFAGYMKTEDLSLQ